MDLFVGKDSGGAMREIRVDSSGRLVLAPESVGGGASATPGRAAAADSSPVVLSTEDLAALGALATQTTAAAILSALTPTYVMPSDACGQVAGATTAAPLAGSSRIFSGGVTLQNEDTSLTAYIGPSGTNQTASHYGRRLLPGESMSLPPVDIATVHVYAASGSPVVKYFGLDLA